MVTSIGEAAREPARGVAGAEQKPHHRSERVGRRHPDEMQMRDRRLEIGRERGGIVDRAQLCAQRSEEAERAEIDPVAGRRDHVVGGQLLLDAIRTGDAEMDLSAIEPGGAQRLAQMQRRAFDALPDGQAPAGPSQLRTMRVRVCSGR